MIKDKNSRCAPKNTIKQLNTKDKKKILKVVREKNKSPAKKWP